MGKGDIIWAPGSEPESGKKDMPPAYSYYPSGQGGYGSGGYGGQAFSHMMPSPPTCESKDGVMDWNKGSVTINFARAHGSMPMLAFQALQPDAQNNLMDWASNYGTSFRAPPPPPPPEKKPEDKECKGPSCPKSRLDDIRKVPDKDEAKGKKWMCWECCCYEHGYLPAAKLWGDAK